MKRYLKDYQFYADLFDKSTIVQLRDLEQLYLENVSYEDFQDKSNPAYQVFIALAIKRNLERSSFIKEHMGADKRKDDLVRSTPAPVLKCKVCREEMAVFDYEFKKNESEIRFIYRCTNGHGYLKKLRADGKVLPHKMDECVRCGGKVVTEKHEFMDVDTFIDLCADCGHIEILALSANHYSERDFIKYCRFFDPGTDLLDENSDMYPFLFKLVGA